HADRAHPSARLAALERAEDEAGANSLSWYHAFARRIDERRRENLAFLQACRDSGKRVYGLGAPVKGNTLLNTFGIGPDLIECLTERNPHRRGLIAPGSHIPVKIEDELPAPPDVYYVLAWNFRQEILARHQDLVARGVEFFFPVNPREVLAA
ncbi:MAG: methyltransferase, partial [Verrucomicrobia bacterium]|nr:methyltransferase [Verrucomicrobiota bacterium]